MLFKELYKVKHIHELAEIKVKSTNIDDQIKYHPKNKNADGYAQYSDIRQDNPEGFPYLSPNEIKDGKYYFDIISGDFYTPEEALANLNKLDEINEEVSLVPSNQDDSDYQDYVNSQQRVIQKAAQEFNIPIPDLNYAFCGGQELILTDRIWEELKNSKSFKIKDLEHVIKIAQEQKIDVQPYVNAIRNNEDLPLPLVLCWGEGNYWLVGGEIELSIYKALKVTPVILLATMNLKDIHEKKDTKEKEELGFKKLSYEQLKLLKQFLKFASKELNLENFPKGLILSYDNKKAKNQSSYGYFDPESDKIWLYVKNRSLADILRTLAHEIVHLKQREEGRIETNSGETGSPIENEANAQAGVLMRNFGQKHKNIFEGLISRKNILKEIKVVRSSTTFNLDEENDSEIVNQFKVGDFIEFNNIKYEIKKIESISQGLFKGQITYLCQNQKVNNKEEVELFTNDQFKFFIQHKTFPSNPFYRIYEAANGRPLVWNLDVEKDPAVIENIQTGDIIKFGNNSYKVINKTPDTFICNNNVQLTIADLTKIINKEYNNPETTPAAYGDGGYNISEIKIKSGIKPIFTAIFQNFGNSCFSGQLGKPFDNLFICRKLYYKEKDELEIRYIGMYDIESVEKNLEILNIPFKTLNHSGVYYATYIKNASEYFNIINNLKVINEIADLSSKFEWHIRNKFNSVWSYNFDSPKNNFTVRFINVGGGEWERIYYKSYSSGEATVNPFQSTNEGIALKINATVMDITLDFLGNIEKNYTFTSLIINPIDDKRYKLVMYFLRKYLSVHQWTVIGDGDEIKIQPKVDNIKEIKKLENE